MSESSSHTRTSDEPFPLSLLMPLVDQYYKDRGLDLESELHKLRQSKLCPFVYFNQRLLVV